MTAKAIFNNQIKITEIKCLNFHRLRLTTQTKEGEIITGEFSRGHINNLCKKHYGVVVEEMKQYTY